VTTMTQPPAIGEIRKDAEGVEYIFEGCGRCSGTGHYSFNPMDGTRCFDCRGRRGRWVAKADHDRRAHNRELAAARRAKKVAAEQAEREAVEAQRVAELPGKIAALLTVHPALAGLLQLDSYDGFLGSLRKQLEEKGSLPERQIEAAEKSLAQRAKQVEAPIGEIGERREFTGKIVWFRHDLNIHSYHEAYTTTVIIVTEEGAIRWKSSKQLDVQQGDMVTLTATVKAHEVGKNDRIITVVTRGKITG